MTRPELVPVAFHGDGEGVEELSWGQWELWEGLDRLRTWMPISVVQPVPPDTTVEDVAGQLRFMMSRHQTMRTRLRFDPDGPKQVVHRTGEIQLEVIDTEEGEEPAKAAEQVERRLMETPYDFADQWPVRMAAIRHHGVLTHVVLVVCHLVTDARGAAVLMSDLAARDPVTGDVPYPPAAAQPLTQARWQRSPAGQRQSRMALRYWEDLLRTIPARRFPGTAQPRQPRYWQAGFDSPAALLGVRAIAARTGVGTASILLTIFCIAVARLTGINPVATRVIVDNRFRPGFAEVVGPLAQAGLLVVDLAGLTFDAALDRTRRRSMLGYKYSYFDASLVYQLIDQIGRERGEELHLGCFFNDRRGQAATEPVPAAPSRQELESARSRTAIRWERQQDEPFEELFLHVNKASDTLDLTAQFDTCYLSPADVEALLRGMEEVAVEAAFNSMVPTGVPAGGAGDAGGGIRRATGGAGGGPA